MKITRNGVTLEGTPDELAEYDSKMKSRRPQSIKFSTTGRKKNSFSSPKTNTDAFSMPEDLMGECLKDLDDVRKTKKFRKPRDSRVLFDREAFTVHWWNREFKWSPTKIEEEIKERKMGKMNGEGMTVGPIAQLLRGIKEKGYRDIGYVFDRIYPDYVSRVRKGAR